MCLFLVKRLHMSVTPSWPVGSQQDILQFPGRNVSHPHHVHNTCCWRICCVAYAIVPEALRSDDWLVLSLPQYPAAKGLNRKHDLILMGGLKPSSSGRVAVRTAFLFPSNTIAHRHCCQSQHIQPRVQRNSGVNVCRPRAMANNPLPRLREQSFAHITMRMFMWHKDQKSVCHFLIALLQKAQT